MRYTFKQCCLAAAVLALFCSSAAIAQTKLKFKDLSGSVTNAQHKPLPGAVVKLEADDTQIVESFLTDRDGEFHFKRVSGDMDYHLWATYKGHRSKMRHISHFSSGMTPVMNLRITTH